MTPQVIEVTRPPASSPGRFGREGAAASDWVRLIRALAATDDDELPLFGRLPG